MEKKKYMVHRCCVVGCDNWKKTRKMEAKYFRFPSNQERCAQWVRSIGDSELAEIPHWKLSSLKTVCERHFPDKDIVRGSRRVHLAANAIPSLNLNSVGASKENSETKVVAHTDTANVQDDTAVLEGSQDVLPPVNSETSAPEEIAVEDESLMDPGTNCEDVSNDDLMSYMKHQLCRICGMKHNELSSIFCESTACEEFHITLEQKIEMYLPIKVCKNDVLPLSICLKCLDLVESWHELYVSCLAADAVLKKTLGVDKLEVFSREAGCNNSKAKEDQNGRISDKEEIPENQSSGICKQHFTLINTGSRKPEDEGLSENWDHDYNLKSHHLYTKSDSIRCVPLTLGKLGFRKCKYCHLYFSVEEEHARHKKQCALEPTICDICGQKVRERRLLRSHIGRHISVPGLCEKCGSEFPSKRSLSRHKYKCQERGYGPKHFCDPCCRVFSKQEAFQAHQEWHKRKLNTNFRIFSSDSCRVNSDDECFICPVCIGPFNDKLSLITHMNKINQTNCANCKAVLRNERDVFQHNCKKLCCRFCSMEFKQRRSLGQHLLVHKTDKDFPCKLCGRKYFSQRSYYRHQLNHKPCKFCCEVCGDQFRVKVKYEDHMRRHSGIKLKCLLCDREFYSSLTFRKHKYKYHRGFKMKSV